MTNVAYAYTGGNGTISGFVVHSDGTVAAVPGSPFTGTGISLVTNGAYLFELDKSGSTAVDGSPQSIGSYKIDKGTGSLSLASVNNGLGGGGGTLSALSLDHSGQSLYASEYTSDGGNAFDLFDVSGGVQGPPKQFYSLGFNPYWGGPISFSPDDKYAYGVGCYHGDFNVYGLSRASDGSLTAFMTKTAIPNYNSNDQYCAFNIAIAATGYMVMEYSSGEPNTPAYLALYKIGADGSLTLAQNTAVATAFAPYFELMEFDPTGTYLAVGGSGGLQMFQLTGATLAPLENAAQNSNVNFTGLHWDHSNQVLLTTGSALYVYTSANGVLTLAPGSPNVADGAGLAVLPLK